jgi:hypothetical protein
MKPLMATLASSGAWVPSPPLVEDDAARESAEAASVGLLGASLASMSARPPSPLMDDEDDLFSGGDFFSLPMPSFTHVVGVGMTVKPNVL